LEKNKQEYEHILPDEYEHLNYASLYRSELLQFIRQNKYKLHSPTHLNSSQIMCFNFFYPLMKEGELDQLAKIIKVNESVSKAEFELVPEVNEGTNIDFMLEFKSGRRALFEIKYSESSFGSRNFSKLKLMDQDKYEKKYVEYYMPNLQLKIHPNKMSIHTVLNNYIN
jgi:hypothetical protein